MFTARIVAYLISLAVGYWVLTVAAKEKGNLQKIGKALGWIIIVVSLIGPICLGWCRWRCNMGPSGCGYGSSCPMDQDGSGWGHHRMGKWNDRGGMMEDKGNSK